MSEYTTNVTTIGLSRKEQLTLDYIFKLSTRYHLVEAGDDSAQLVLVNVDDPNAILYWKSHLDNGVQRAVIVSEMPGRYGDAVYLSRRFLQRPCFAKQVLSGLERVRLRPECARLPEVLVEPRRFSGIRRVLEQCAQLKKSLSLSAQSIPANNPYYG